MHKCQPPVPCSLYPIVGYRLLHLENTREKEEVSVVYFTENLSYINYVLISFLLLRIWEK